jgi:hypothetical protein
VLTSDDSNVDPYKDPPVFSTEPIEEKVLLGAQSSVLTWAEFSFVRQLGSKVEAHNFPKLEWL